VVLGRHRINAGINTDVANKELGTLDQVRHLVDSSSAKAACVRHRYAPSRLSMAEYLVPSAKPASVPASVVGGTGLSPCLAAFVEKLQGHFELCLQVNRMPDGGILNSRLAEPCG
jgi:hypothetical protein